MLRDIFGHDRGSAVNPPEGDPPTGPSPGGFEIEAESADPSTLGSGEKYVRCRTCGRDIGPVVDEIPDDALCPECGAFPFQFDVSQ